MKFLVFLLLLLIFAVFFSTFLHIIGIHCNSSKIPVKTSILHPITNYEIMSSKDEIYNTTSYTPPQSGFELRYCVFETCFVPSENKYYWASHEKCDNLSTQFSLSRGGSTLFGGIIDFACVDCDNWTPNYSVYGVIGSKETSGAHCFSDAFRIPTEDMGWVQRNTCNLFESDCMPPEHYYWESDTGLITCLDDEVCGVNQTEIIYTTDILLDQAGAELLYPVSVSDNDYRRFIQIKCDAELTPKFTIYGIPIFDYRAWLFIVLIYIMFIFLSKIKSH